MANIGKLMKQAQEMQAKMGKLQDELAAMEVEGTSGGGMVTVKMNGQQEILSVKIEPEVFDDGDREMLEDLIAAAANEARRAALDLAQSEMAKITGGMPMPGMF